MLLSSCEIFILYARARSFTCNSTDYPQSKGSAGRPDHVSAETVTHEVYVGRFYQSHSNDIIQKPSNYVAHVDGQVGWNLVQEDLRHTAPVYSDDVINSGG